MPGVDPSFTTERSTGYLNVNAFTARLERSETGRNSIYGPGYKNVDFSITKQTQIAEHLGLQLRAEFFNIFNHPNFAQPNHNVDPGFSGGELTQTPDVAQTNPGLGGGGPRVVQLGLKLVF